MSFKRLAFAVPLVVAGCIPKPVIEDQARLSSACQVTKCQCMGEKTSVFTTPKPGTIRWRLDGSAYCEEGFHLERVTDEKKPGY
jgi:hypothetical protein